MIAFKYWKDYSGSKIQVRLEGMKPGMLTDGLT